MDRLRLRDSANRLLLEVERAKQAGYSRADAVLTPEVQRLLPEILELRLADPVELQFTAGPAHNFSETELGNCKELEAAWANFCIEVQGQREFLEELKAQMGWSA